MCIYTYICVFIYCALHLTVIALDLRQDNPEFLSLTVSTGWQVTWVSKTRVKLWAQILKGQRLCGHKAGRGFQANSMDLDNGQPVPSLAALASSTSS
jgi:hypothetical protein